MDNIGGIARLYICPVANLTVGGNIADVNQLLPIHFSQDTGIRKCTRKADKTGEYYDLSVECVVPRSDSDTLLADILPVDFAVVSVDANGVVRLDGNREEPLRYECESNTGEKFEDLNCVRLKFSRKLRFPSPVITL